jgi:probable HAF family extracellular repeat protein
MVGLDSTYSRATDVSADGSVIVGTWGSQAMRWTQETGFVGLGDFPGGLFGSWANAVSADGSVVVGLGSIEVCIPHFGCGSQSVPFRWTQASGMVRLMIAVPPWDLSADGSVIVGGSGEAVRWTQATGSVGLGDLPGGEVRSSAYGVSADGSVIVGYGTSDAGVEAFRWTPDSGMVGLGILPGYGFSSAQDVSSDGSLVVGSFGFEGTYAGTFIWDASHGMRNLSDVLINLGLGDSLAGWSLDFASAISADGRVIVGYGTNPDGNTEAWIARLAPQPTLPGDFNHDGAVDAADYVVWRKTDGTQTGYNTWRAHFGEISGSGSAAPPPTSAIPEPTSALLFLSFAVIGVWRHPRGFHRLKFMAAKQAVNLRTFSGP